MAGRPKGSLDKVPRSTLPRRQAAVRALSGALPLDVMLLAMKEHLDLFREHKAKFLETDAAHERTAALAAIDIASAHAVTAAPYCHSKLSALRDPQKPMSDADALSDAELASYLAANRPHTGDGGGDAAGEEDEAEEP